MRYADDFVMGFQYRADAEQLWKELSERLSKFSLELHEDKTRLIEFGRFAATDRKGRGQGKPETFDFLGFTHICSKRRKDGKFTIRRKTIAKRVRAKLKAVRECLMRKHALAGDGDGKVAKSGVPGAPARHDRVSFGIRSG